jgi:hypothetical protein
MKIVKKSLQIVFRFLLGSIAFVIVYIVAVLLLSRIPVNSDRTHDAAEIPVYIMTNGVHTDIVVPVKNAIVDWTREIRFGHTRSQDSIANYIAFGWGDKGFYLDTPEWSDLKASTAFKAISGLGSSAMHTTFYRKLTEGNDCRKLLLSKAEYKQLTAYIVGSFKRNSDGKLQWITGHSYGKNDAFYEAKGAYNLFYTCNTWANNALKAGQQKACLWTVYDKGIFYHYEKEK